MGFSPLNFGSENTLHMPQPIDSFKRIKNLKIIGKESTKNFLLVFHASLFGIIVGVVCSLFRIGLNHIEIFRNALFNNFNGAGIIGKIAPFLFAFIGIVVSIFLVRKFAPETAGSGVHEIEGALDGLRPMRWKRVLPIKAISSLFSLGSGLLLGREGPTVQLGANIGKMFKDVFKLSSYEDNPYISAGAAAGLASAFNAPFAGIIFIMEEMHDQFKYNFYSIAAIMIGSGTADLVVRLLVGDSPILHMPVMGSPPISGIWLFIILGIICGFVGYFYNKAMIKTIDIFQPSKKIPILAIGLVASLVIATFGIFFPEVIGGGYDTISGAINNAYPLKLLFVILVVRTVLSIFSYGIGAPGGLFAPLITLGVILGSLFGTALQSYFPDLIQHPIIFGVAGMAGLFSATVRAPLTGLVLAVEMTSNYELILPLIIVTVTASVITTMLGNEPIYRTLLHRVLDKAAAK